MLVAQTRYESPASGVLLSFSPDNFCFLYQFRFPLRDYLYFSVVRIHFLTGVLSLTMSVCPGYGSSGSHCSMLLRLLIGLRGPDLGRFHGDLTSLHALSCDPCEQHLALPSGRPACQINH